MSSHNAPSTTHHRHGDPVASENKPHKPAVAAAAPPPLKKPAVIVAGFARIGRSWLTKAAKNPAEYGVDTHGFKVINMDSPNYRKDDPDRFAKYAKDILDTAEKGNVIVLISTHPEVRHLLRKAGQGGIVRVYPKRELRDEYLHREEKRSGVKDGDFEEYLKEKWDWLIDQVESEGTSSPRVILKKGQHLSDRLKDVIDEASKKETSPTA